MIRDRYSIEDQKTDRWLISYADFITLLFAFFVVMYSISSVNEGKYRVLSQAFEQAFSKRPQRSLNPIQIGDINRTHHDVSGSEDDPKGAEWDGSTEIDFWGGLQTEENLDELAVLNNELTTQLDTLIDKGFMDVRLNEGWLEISMNNGLLFKSGRATLTSSAKPLIEKITEIIQDTRNEIRVRGYTDNVPIATEEFETNWDLSAFRAIAVMQLMMKNGVAPTQMAAEGYGEFRPIADNSTAEGRAKNRRVVIAVSKNKIEPEFFERVQEADAPPVEKETEPEIDLIRQEDGSLLIRGRGVEGEAQNPPSPVTQNDEETEEQQ